MNTMRERIMAALEQARMTQAELAEHCQVSKSAVSHWLHPDERKRKSPAAHHLRRISEVTGVGHDWLAFGEGSDVAVAPRPPEVREPDSEYRTRRRYRRDAGSRLEQEIIGKVRARCPSLVTCFERALRVPGPMTFIADYASNNLVVEIKGAMTARTPQALWMLAQAAVQDRYAAITRRYVLLVVSPQPDAVGRDKVYAAQAREMGLELVWVHDADEAARWICEAEGV